MLLFSHYWTPLFLLFRNHKTTVCHFFEYKTSSQLMFTFIILWGQLLQKVRKFLVTLYFLKLNHFFVSASFLEPGCFAQKLRLYSDSTTSINSCIPLFLYYWIEHHIGLFISSFVIFNQSQTINIPTISSSYFKVYKVDLL